MLVWPLLESGLSWGTIHKLALIECNKPWSALVQISHLAIICGEELSRESQSGSLIKHIELTIRPAGEHRVVRYAESQKPSSD